MVKARGWIGLALIVVLSGCGGSSLRLGDTPARGDLLTYQKTSDYSWEYMDSVLTYAGVDLDAEVYTSFYKITYTTVDLSGQLVTVSGAVAIPDGSQNLGLVSYQHSTATQDTNVPSHANDEAIFIAAAYASSGKYVVSMADYLGLGVNPGLHPYLNAQSEASASLDAMRAARTLCANLNVKLNGNVYLAGYSQGGHSTMALSKTIQDTGGSEFKVVASAPMSGPYDLSDTQLHFALDDPGPDTNTFLAYITLAYNSIYTVYSNPNQAFIPPWDTKVGALFDGTKDITTIANTLPTAQSAFFQPQFLADIVNLAKPMQIDLKLNDLWNWNPQMPMTIYAARSDEIVAFENAEKAYDQFVANGAPHVKLVDLGGNLKHVDGIEPAVYDSRLWFDSL